MRTDLEDGSGTDRYRGNPDSLMQPPVSVVLPFRDEERFLGEALASLRTQDMPNFEAVLVDDGSSDTSTTIAESFCAADGRFRIAACRGSGLVDALNTGLGEARGEWVARMDADDICEPERLGTQLREALSSGPRTVISCRVRSFPDDRVSGGFRAYEDWLNGLLTPAEIERNLFVESPIPHPTAFFHRRSVLDEGGYAERLLPEDYELWLRLWSRGFSFRRVEGMLLHWRERPDRYSRRSHAYSLTSFYRLKARYLALVPCMSGRRVIMAGGGETATRLARCLRAEGFSIEAFMDPDGSRNGDRILGAPILGPQALLDFPDLPVVGASRAPGARTRIRAFLEDEGLQEWRRFVLCS
jgi:glycosyltransferase involved in cell wall biosynthesis